MSNKLTSDLTGPAPSYLFSVALRKNSNEAMDWLWLAAQLADETERQYCLKRASQLDPRVTVVDDPRDLVGAVKTLIDHLAAKL